MLLNHQQNRTVIRSEILIENVGFLDTIPGRMAYQEVINAPSHITLPGSCKVAEVRVLDLIRVQMTERIREARIQHPLEFLSLLLREAWRVPIGLWIVQIDFLMRTIQIAAENHRYLMLPQFRHIQS